MNRFDRQPEPAFWADRVHQWIALLLSGEPASRTKLHDWLEEGKSLAHWFRDTARPPDEGAFCAYCDALLGGSARDTIDHWVPSSTCPPLYLWWGNLFPACDGCQAAKKARWSVDWVRPDIDHEKGWIRYDWQSGRLRVSPTVTDPTLRERIELTLNEDGLDLNRGGLLRERRAALRLLAKGTQSRD